VAQGAAILMYHAVGAPGEAATRFVVPLERFERQLEWLGKVGYRVVCLEELVLALGRGRIPSRTAAITFDDGYAGNLTSAHPLLERLGLPATVFTVTCRRTNDWDRDNELAGRPLLTTGDLAQLSPLITIGAHTRTHPALTGLSPEQLEEEISGSRSDLEAALGRPVTTFAYPYGLFDEVVRAAVERAGFGAACTVVPGHTPSGGDPLALRRLEIQGTFSLPRFALTVEVGDTRLLTRWRARRAPRGVG
jgi:peptidoglycan/xylan/chitin deacetylase (PgdA/CDA1 family)